MSVGSSVSDGGLGSERIDEGPAQAEIIRIKNEHRDDNQCIVNDRVKGRLKLNDAMLEMFRNEYIGTAPYLSCSPSPSLCHHQLSPRDQFKFPEGDPAQHLVEEVLSRAAKKAGLDLHELLDIPQGDRRKYHDDVTVM
ncbi:hypothetical protein Tsubulata_009357, partial [Turnera subulata]